MKILLVSHSQKYGGAEKCLFEAAVGLRQRGHEIVVFIPSDGELNKMLQRADIDTIVFSYPWWVYLEKDNLSLWHRVKGIGSNMWYTLRVGKAIRKISPDLVITNTLCISVAAVASFLLRKRHYWFIHEFGKEDHGLLFYLGFYVSSKIISSVSEGVYVNSKAILQKYSRYIDSKKFNLVRLDIPRPHTAAKITATRNDSVDLLLVGQINRNKGQADAVRAFHILQSSGFSGMLFVVGQIADENYYQELQAYIVSHQLESNIRFFDHMPDPFNVVRGFTIGLVCSEMEAFGRVTIEYMKLGIPVIGANSSTTASIIQHGVTGMLYHVRDPEHLAHRISELIGNQTLIDTVVENAKGFANHNFNAQNFIDDIRKGIVDNDTGDLL